MKAMINLKKFVSMEKVKHKNYLVVVILLASFLVRLTRFDFPSSYTFAWGDGTRDFLIANHILKFHEFPLVGPFNLLYESGVRNSPIYFYLISLPLALCNSILTLSLVNIFIQILVIVLIYLVAKKLFNSAAAMTAVLLFSFNPEVVKQADFVWQPYLMLPFALMGLYLKLKGRDLLGLSALCFATLLHSSAYPWVIVFYIYHQKNIKYYKAAATIILTALFLNGFSNFSFSLPMNVTSLSNYLTNVWVNFGELLRVFYLKNMLTLILAALFLLGLVKSKDKTKLIFLFLLFISPILMAASFNKIRLHYLILSLAILPILAAGITQYFRGRVKLLVTIALLLIFSGGFAYFREIKKPLENQKNYNDVIAAVTLDLDEVKRKDHFLDYNFFQIVSFVGPEANQGKIIPYPVLDTYLLVGLEEKLSKKLTQTSDLSPYNYIQLNSSNYLIVLCFKFAQDDQCLNYFSSEFRDYNILKKIYNIDSTSLYLARHETI